MKVTHREATKVFVEHDNIMRLSDALRLGIPKHVIYEMYEHGLLVKEGRGLYRLAQMGQLGNPDLVQAALLVPKGIICLYSALHFHNLTTQIPYRIYLALPRNIQKPRITYPPLEIIWVSKKPFETGVEEHTIDGVKVKIYGREKTVADCFKFRNKVENSVAVEALKDYLNQPGRNLDKLIYYSQVDRVEKRIKPYIEAAL